MRLPIEGNSRNEIDQGRFNIGSDRNCVTVAHDAAFACVAAWKVTEGGARDPSLEAISRSDVPDYLVTRARRRLEAALIDDFYSAAVVLDQFALLQLPCSGGHALSPHAQHV